MTRQAHPLDWPAGVPRTPERERGSSWKFQATLAQAVRELFEELDRLGATDIVLSTNQRTRRDGRPRADDNGDRVRDPGAALYWRRAGRDHVMTCDRYDSLRGNVRALGLSIVAIRSLERHGGTELLDRAFQGFQALPATAGANGSRPWRDVLELENARHLDVWLVKARFRRLAQNRHPDRGGDADAFAELVRARDEGLAELAR